MPHPTRTTTIREADRSGDRAGSDLPATFNPWVPEMEQRMETLSSCVAHRIVHYLARIRRYSDATVKVSQARIAEAVKASADGVRTALNLLKAEGFITWIGRHRRASTYTLLYIRPADSTTRDQRENVDPCPQGSRTPVRPLSTRVHFPEGSFLPEKNSPLPPVDQSPVEQSPTSGEGESPAEFTDPGVGAGAPASDENAGWSNSRDAERLAGDRHPVPEKLTRQAVEDLVGGALVLQPGEALIPAGDDLRAVDADTLPVTPLGAVRAAEAVLGGAVGPHAEFARRQVERLAVMGDLTPRMLAVAHQRATDHRGTGYTRFVAEVVLQLHAARLSSRRREHLETIRAERRLDDCQPPSSPRTRWVADLVAGGMLLGLAENSSLYLAMADRRVACAV